jgi:L-ascorbate metabolism protein UlaG (beta-lactamase superfamily)
VTILSIPCEHVRFDLPLVWKVLRRAGLGELLAFGREAAGYPCGGVLGYQFGTCGYRALHFGSAGWQRAALADMHPNVAMVPLQGHSRVCQRAAQLIELLQPKRVIAHHHDSFFPPVTEQVDTEPFFRLLRVRVPGIEAIDPCIGKWTPLF